MCTSSHQLRVASDVRPNNTKGTDSMMIRCSQLAEPRDKLLATQALLLVVCVVYGYKSRLSETFMHESRLITIAVREVAAGPIYPNQLLDECSAASFPAASKLDPNLAGMRHPFGCESNGKLCAGFAR